MTNQQPTLFTYIDQILTKSGQYKYDKKIANGYILTLGLSNDNGLVGIVNKINHIMFSLSDEIIYKYLFYSIPKGKRFIKWPKKVAKEKTKNNLQDLKLQYNLSDNELKHFL